jgi:renierapurpurin 18,18'-hydroxylase
MSCAQGEKYMFEALSAKDETLAAGSASGPDRWRDNHSGAVTDLRRIGINPNFWYPVAASGSVRKKKTFAATFAGERIALIAATAARSTHWRTGAPTARYR